MPLLIDEFAPQKYEDVFFHKDIYDMLHKMSQDNSIPHVIFHGATGCGKRTMTRVFLNMLYGDSISKLYTTEYNITSSGNKTKKEYVQNSAHHIIINPTGTNFDRYLVHEIVKKYASSQTIELANNPNSKFKTIQISKLDKLSHSAQTSLRRMIEVNASICRFVMWCDNLSNVIGPLKSRCVCIRIPRPSPDMLFAYLTTIAIKKNFKPKLTSLLDIVSLSECDIRRALWGLQLNIFGYDHKNSYHEKIDSIVDMIVKLQILHIEDIRDAFFNIWITYYDGVQIIRDILRKLIDRPDLNEECKANIIIRFSELEFNLLRGRREIIHFDSVVIGIMKNIVEHNTDKNTTKNTIKNTKNVYVSKNKTILK